MKIKDFSREHVAQAAALTLADYNEERRHVPALPPIKIEEIPDLTGFAANDLGVAAFDGDTLLGFLCGQGVWRDAWDIPGLGHVFSPMHLNGAVAENRAAIYARLYQAAAEKWVAAGALSHGICLYAHDKAAREQFYRYGFGLRCVDAIREIADIDPPPFSEDYHFSMLAPEEISAILPLNNLLDKGFSDSPIFMSKRQQSKEELRESYQRFQPVYFTARHEGKIIAFIRAELDGETFIKDTPGYIHVKGAYCLPEYRGEQAKACQAEACGTKAYGTRACGISRHLLYLLMKELKTRNYTRLGVDFESFNPAGAGFWLKHFAAYTHSVVRRIDGIS